MKADNSTEGPTHPRPPKLHPTLGLLTPQISDPNGQALCLGIADTARALGANVICFVGGELHSNLGFEAQKNVLYDLVNPGNVDGLVLWLAALGNFVESEGLW